MVEVEALQRRGQHNIIIDLLLVCHWRHAKIHDLIFYIRTPALGDGSIHYDFLRHWWGMDDDGGGREGDGYRSSSLPRVHRARVSEDTDSFRKTQSARESPRTQTGC